MKSIGLLAAALLLLAPAVLAQTPYIETFEVQLHNLDVVVTDAQGNPVRGLKKSDFVVLENGVAQPVTNFSLYDTSAGTASGTPAAPETETYEATQPPPRHFVFFIDEIEVQRRARQKLYRRLQEFVAGMRDGDVASVVRPTVANKVVQDFTGDRAAIELALKTAIDQSDLKMTGLTGDIAQLRNRLSLENLPENCVGGRGGCRRSTTQLAANRAMAQREYAFASRRRVEHRLGQLRALTSSLGGIQGRKILVMVTMGLGSVPGGEVRSMEQEFGLDELGDELDDATQSLRSDVITYNWMSAIDEIARAAATNGVTIYALEPEVHLSLLTRGSASIPARAGPRRGGENFGPDLIQDIPASMHVDLLQNSAATLNSLSEKTGGRWFRGDAGIDDTFKELSRDLSVYYSLAYRATGEDNRPHDVKVQVRDRPELHVRTRTEVLQKSTSREMADLVVASLIYPRPVNELGVDVTAGVPVKALGYFTIPLEIVIPLNKLTFLPSQDGTKYVALFNLHYASAGKERDFVSGGKKEQIVEITPAQHAEVSRIRYRYRTGITVSEGASKIAIGLIDETTKLTGFDTVEVVAR
jgi:VWFA-related protein